MASAGCFAFFRRPAARARPASQRIIRIDARGRQLAASIQTLSKTESSALQDLVAKAADHGAVDLDVDPQVFAHVLNFLRDGAGFMMPNSSDELFALLELAEDLRMPELVEVMMNCPAEYCEPTNIDEWPMRNCFAGQAITDCSLAQLMGDFGDEGKWETSSTFPDDDRESEGSDCSEMSVEVSKATLFISAEEVHGYSHRSEDTVFPLDDHGEKPVKRQWLHGN